MMNGYGGYDIVDWCQGVSVSSLEVSLVPRLLCRGGGKRAWYTLFVNAPSSLH